MTFFYHCLLSNQDLAKFVRFVCFRSEMVDQCQDREHGAGGEGRVRGGPVCQRQQQAGNQPAGHGLWRLLGGAKKVSGTVFTTFYFIHNFLINQFIYFYS